MDFEQWFQALIVFIQLAGPEAINWLREYKKKKKEKATITKSNVAPSQTDENGRD